MGAEGGERAGAGRGVRHEVAQACRRRGPPDRSTAGLPPTPARPRAAARRRTRPRRPCPPRPSRWRSRGSAAAHHPAGRQRRTARWRACRSTPPYGATRLRPRTLTMWIEMKPRVGRHLRPVADAAEVAAVAESHDRDTMAGGVVAAVRDGLLADHLAEARSCRRAGDAPRTGRPRRPSARPPPAPLPACARSGARGRRRGCRGR